MPEAEGLKSVTVQLGGMAVITLHDKTETRSVKIQLKVPSEQNLGAPLPGDFVGRTLTVSCAHLWSAFRDRG